MQGDDEEAEAPPDPKHPDQDYKVGKGRPPKHTQFKAGQPSANPRGRGGDPATRAERAEARRRKLAAAEEQDSFERLMQRKIALQVGGVRKKMSVIDALNTSQISDALGGDKKVRDNIVRRHDQMQRAKRPAKAAGSKPSGVVEFRILPEERGILLPPDKNK